jgi:hypothetical protein
MSESAPNDAPRLSIVLVEDDEDSSVFWSALWDRSKNEIWRSERPLIAVDAIEVARQERKRRA